MIHAVGRAADQAPRLLEMRWGKPGAFRLTLVGKGVCFDTGGLDIKPASAMLNMKKDMGGAANVLALAMMIMDAGLPVDLRVLVPAVENSIAASAFRPGDVLSSRKGLTVQIDNTDAEGRLVLGDALTYACEDDPGLLIDMATLTGAARVALGPGPAAVLHRRRGTGRRDLSTASESTVDPLWRMPLYKPYEADVKAQDRRPDQRARGRLRRLDHRGLVSQALRLAGNQLGAFRHLRLVAEGQAACPDGRRSTGHPRPVRRHQQRFRPDWEHAACLAYASFGQYRSVPKRTRRAYATRSPALRSPRIVARRHSRACAR
jgi:hypothetical protein